MRLRFPPLIIGRRKKLAVVETDRRKAFSEAHLFVLFGKVEAPKREMRAFEGLFLLAAHANTFVHFKCR